MFTAVAPLVGAARIILAAGTKFRQTSMVGPLGVLVAGPAAATTDVEEVDSGPPGGCCRDFRQWPPPELKTSMTNTLGVLAAGPAAATTDVEDVYGGPPRGYCQDFW
jgi:hypothetical protein